MRPKQTCICLTNSVYEMCENVCVFAKTKPQSIFTTALQFAISYEIGLLVAAA